MNYNKLFIGFRNSSFLISTFFLFSCQNTTEPKASENLPKERSTQTLESKHLNNTNLEIPPLNNSATQVNPQPHSKKQLKIQIKTTEPNQTIHIFGFFNKYAVDCNNDERFELESHEDTNCKIATLGIHILNIISYSNKNVHELLISNPEKNTKFISVLDWGENRPKWILSIMSSLGQDSEIVHASKSIPLKLTYRVSESNTHVVIPTSNVAPNILDYQMDCDGDGIFERHVLGSYGTCYYKEKGQYQIALSGKIPLIRFFDGFETPNSTLMSIDQWGDNVWYSMNRTMAYTKNATINAKDAPDLSHVTDMSEMFAGAEKMNANINHWDVSNVKDMKRMFYMAKSFNQPLDKWNTSNVVNMTSMFAYARKFNQNINSWNVSNVKNMSGMFYKAEKFNNPLDKWDVSHVEYMPDMFGYTFYNKPLRTWNLASLKDARGMFEHSSSDKYTHATPILFFKDKVFQDKVCQRIESIGRKCYLLYNEAADPWRDRDDYPDDPAYQKDDNDYERIF